MTKPPVLSAEQYHQTDAPTYAGQTDGSHKQSALMARVRYQPAHHNPDAPAAQQGQGETLGTWIFNEEANKAEGLLASNIQLMMDSTLAPHATIGLHQHQDTEEIYYLLEGQLSIELHRAGEPAKTLQLHPGDAHLIRPSESHFVQAGADGARIIVVAAKAT
ncbi:cupin domain-containing protein [Neiella sp. HB171785]|uniref:Cupin domain-containing protein n=1 Tax=Neiella litorisoli TaxID=2771431 RepID=A0A8J6UER6_9GAMM|nr:cupin domain-containing protein [Neiella litorisoli]MBD1388096.1 cupin domain-containing protein [Neiella litorisoli]